MIKKIFLFKCKAILVRWQLTLISKSVPGHFQIFFQVILASQQKHYLSMH